MKKFVIRLFIFLIPISGFIAAWEYGLSRMPDSYSMKREHLESLAPKIEVLVLGPSHSLRGVDPDCFSMKGYNVANIQQSIYYDTRITLKYLDKMTSLKVVLIDISYPSFWFQVHTCDEPFRDYFYAREWGIRYPSIKWYDIHLYSKILAYGNEKAWNFALSGFSTDLERGYQENGWAIGGKKGPLNDSAGYNLAKAHEKEMKQENFADNISDLKIFIGELKKRNIEPVFFIAPYNHFYNKYLDKNRMKTIDSAINGLCSIYSCRKYDYHTDSRFTDEDFREVTHLNKDGAIKFSKILNDEILKNYNSPLLK